MHANHRTLLFILWGAVLWAVGTAMAAEASPPVRLQIPFVNAFAQHDRATPQSYSHENCRISGGQAITIERDASNPCLAADAAPGNGCFDRLGLGMLRAQRALWPHDEGRRCTE